MGMRRFFGSIRFRMVAIYLIVIIFAFVAVQNVVSAIVEEHLVSQRTQSQLTETETFSLAFAAVLQSGSSPAHMFEYAENWARPKNGRLLFLDPDAIVQLDTASEYNGRQLPYREVCEVRANGASSAYGFHEVSPVNTANNPLLFTGVFMWTAYYAVPVMDGGELLGILLYASPIQDVVDSIAVINQRIALIFVVFAVAVGLISLFVSGWLTRPVVLLTNAMRHVGAQGYGERVPVHGKGELARLAEAFNIMSEKLENHDRVRNEFVSNASHELKTPLSSMKILAESMLYQEPDPKIALEFFADINHEVDRLTHIINDLLGLVQVENSERALNIAEMDYAALVRRVIKRLMPLAKQKGIRLESKVVPVTVEADELRIEQVVSNLIDNALKYTEKGSVAVTLKVDGTFAVLAVHDTGIGIPKESISRLFERFYRVDKARSRDTGGTGLGLSIVERIVSMHDGYIHVDSVEGKGTTFTVRLPLRAAHSAPNHPHGESSSPEKGGAHDK